MEFVPRATLRRSTSLDAMRGREIARGVTACVSRAARETARASATVNARETAGAHTREFHHAGALGKREGDREGDRERQRADEPRPMVPWMRQVASGVELLRSGKYNKGMSFTEEERDKLNLRGLLPPAVFDQKVQVERVIQRLRRVGNNIERHAWLASLYERNERLFFSVVREHLEELLPILSAPTVWKVCEEYGLLYRRPRGLYVSSDDRGSVYRLLKNWPVRDVKAVVITDGQRVTGLGDLGVQGMGMAVGKATLLTSLGGLDPSDVLPICIDVGTDNEALLQDKFYIGSRRKRITGDDYDDLIEEVVQGIKRRFGQRTLFFFEEFSNRNAKRMLDRYTRNSVALVDDLQCIATTVLAALISALSQTQGSLLDQRFLFAGAGETGTYAADLLASYIAQRHGIPLPQARRNIFFIDRKGLVTRERAETEDDLELHKLPYAHDIETTGSSVLEAVKLIKPTALIGIRRHRFSFFEGSVLKDEKLFKADVLREMAECSERPIIMALSRPAALHECTAEEAYEATNGKCIFVGGCHSPPFKHNGKDVAPSECTTEYVFPGLALGLTIAEGTRVRDSILIEVAETVAESASNKDIDHGAVFPRKRHIPELSAHVAASVASKLFANGWSALPEKPIDWLRLAKSWMFNPAYRLYN